jgi:AcrR family transcriptional regulator
VARHAGERLLDTAERFFYAEGIRAVGIDRILAESGVGKASLYRHFATKDELVVAVLRRRDEAWRRWLRDAVAERDLPPAQRPLAVFDALAERFRGKDYRGCAFINTIVEVADPTSPAHAVANEHKRRLTGYLADLLADAGRADSRAMAARLVLLVDGAIVTSVRERSADAAEVARGIAAVLLAEPAPVNAQ